MFYALLSLLPSLLLFSEISAASEYVRDPISVEFQGRKGRATLLLPVGLERSTKLPVVVVFGGFENAARTLELLEPLAKQAELHDLAFASFDYPFTPKRRFLFPQSLLLLPEIKRMVHDTISGIRSLVRKLEQHPRIDPTRIILVGASFGAPFVLWAAQDGLPFSHLVIVHGFGDIPGTAQARMNDQWSEASPLRRAFLRGSAWLFIHLAWAYLNLPHPEEAAEKFLPGQKVLMVTAKTDSFIPPASTEALWKALKESRAQTKRLDLDMGHLMPGSKKELLIILREVGAWLAASEKRRPGR